MAGQASSYRDHSPSRTHHLSNLFQSHGWFGTSANKATHPHLHVCITWTDIRNAAGLDFITWWKQMELKRSVFCKIFRSTFKFFFILQPFADEIIDLLVGILRDETLSSEKRKCFIILSKRTTNILNQSELVFVVLPIGSYSIRASGRRNG